MPRRTRETLSQPRHEYNAFTKSIRLLHDLQKFYYYLDANHLPEQAADAQWACIMVERIHLSMTKRG